MSIVSWAFANGDKVPIPPDRRVVNLATEGLVLENQGNDLKAEMEAIEDKIVALEDAMKVANRDLVLIEGAYKSVIDEALDLPPTVDIEIECLRLQGKRDSLFALHWERTDRVFGLTTKLLRAKAERLFLKILRDHVLARFNVIVETLKSIGTAFGSFSTSDPDVAVFLVRYTQSLVLVPLNLVVLFGIFIGVRRFGFNIVFEDRQH